MLDRCQSTAALDQRLMTTCKQVWRAAMLMLGSLCIAGCATQQFAITTAITQYRAAQTCCHSFAEIPFGQFPSSVDTAVIIDSKSPAYNFDGTSLSYFAAFELPRRAGAMSLRIQCQFIQDAAGPNIRDVFVPAIMLLDQQKNPIHVTDGQIGMSVSEAMISAGTPYIESSLDLGRFPTARYLIVFARPESFGDALMIDVTIPRGVIAAGRIEVQAPPVTYSDSVRASPMAPRGALTVSLQ
jgi:Maltose operon periplasmic protein precursor (MalM)